MRGPTPSSIPQNVPAFRRSSLLSRHGPNDFADASRSAGRLSRFREGVRHDVSKSDVNVPHRSEAEIDFIANDPGLSLFHCHCNYTWISGSNAWSITSRTTLTAPDTL